MFKQIYLSIFCIWQGVLWWAAVPLVPLYLVLYSKIIIDILLWHLILKISCITLLSFLFFKYLNVSNKGFLYKYVLIGMILDQTKFLYFFKFCKMLKQISFFLQDCIFTISSQWIWTQLFWKFKPSMLQLNNHQKLLYDV